MAKHTGLKQKLMWMMLFLIGIPLAVSTVFSIQTLNEKLESDQLKLVESSAKVAAKSFNDLSAKAENYASTLANNHLLLQGLQSGDQAVIGQAVDPVFKDLTQKEDLDVLEIGDANGTVLYRAHAPEKFGDSKKDDVLIQKALSGTTAWGVAEGSSGFAVRAVLPVQAGDQVIGTVMTGFGFDNAVVDGIKDISGVEATIFVGNKRVATTITDEKGERQVGTTQDDPQILDTVLKKKENYTGEAEVLGKPYLVCYQPILDSKGDALGMLFVGLNQEDVLAFKSRFVLLQSVIGIVGLAVALSMAFFFVRGIVRPLQQIVEKMGLVAEGNLNVAAKVERNDEIKLLADGFNQMAATMHELIGKLQTMVKQLATATQQMEKGAGETKKATNEITVAIQEIANGAGEQASAVENVAKTIEGLHGEFDQVSHHTQTAQEIAQNVAAHAVKGEQTITETIDQMQVIRTRVDGAANVVQNLSSSSQRIGEIVDMITGIAEQTNLLALNAAIEAARAGENGRGFAVVADEVRKLAEEAAAAAGQIAELISKMQGDAAQAVAAMAAGTSEVAKGTVVVDQAGAAFREISAGVQVISERTADVNSVVQGMTQAGRKAMESIEGVAAIAQETAASTEEVAASTEEQAATVEEFARLVTELGEMAREVEQMVERFQC